MRRGGDLRARYVAGPCRFNPLIADTPQVGLAITSAPSIALVYTDTTGTEQSVSVERSSSFSTSQTTSSSTTESYSVESSWNVSGGVEKSFEDGVKLSAGGGYSQTTTEETSVTWSTANTTENSTGFSRGEAAARSQSTSITGGVIAVTFDVSNLGHVSFTVDNLVLSAFLRDARTGELSPVGNLSIDSPTSTFPSFTLPPGGAARGLTMINAGLDVGTVRTLLRDSSGLHVQVGYYEITDASGRSFAHDFTQIFARTAGVLVDYGGAGGRRNERYLVATLAHPAAAGIDARAALEDVLGLRPDTDGDGYVDGVEHEVGTGPTETFDTPKRFVAAGLGDHRGRILAGGEAEVWGSNSHGQLGGVPSGAPPHAPWVTHPGPWRSLSAGYRFTVGVKSTGELWYRGDVRDGEIVGPPDPACVGPSGDCIPPARVGSGSDWAVVDAGDFFVVALEQDGTLWSFGSNGGGQLGIRSTAPSPLPALVSAERWTAVSAGSRHVLAIREDGTLWSWGANEAAVLGYVAGEACGSALPCQKSPRQVDGHRWRVAAAGWEHSLAIRDDGRLFAWGANFSGQLGIGSTDFGLFQTTPVEVGGGPWMFVDATGDSGFASTPAGEIFGWGRNSSDELGIGSKSDLVVSPERIAPAVEWRLVWGANDGAMALAADGTLYTWGGSSSGLVPTGACRAGAGTFPCVPLPTPLP